MRRNRARFAIATANFHRQAGKCCDSGHTRGKPSHLHVVIPGQRPSRMKCVLVSVLTSIASLFGWCLFLVLCVWHLACLRACTKGRLRAGIFLLGYLLSLSACKLLLLGAVPMRSGSQLLGLPAQAGPRRLALIGLFCGGYGMGPGTSKAVHKRAPGNGRRRRTPTHPGLPQGSGGTGRCMESLWFLHFCASICVFSCKHSQNSGRKIPRPHERMFLVFVFVLWGVCFAGVRLIS